MIGGVGGCRLLADIGCPGLFAASRFSYKIKAMAEITQKSLEHLADLARIELSESETDKFLKDLGNILNYFKELESLDTKDVAPMTGGTALKNVMREDMPFEADRFDRPD